MRQVALFGGGVWLSAPSIADVPAITACCQEPGLAEMTSSIAMPYTEADATHFVTAMVLPEWAEGTALNWGVRREEGGELVGMVGLHGRTGYSAARLVRGGFAFTQAELGYWLSGAVRSQGLMTKAALLVCAFGFDELGLSGIDWRALCGNVPSARVARRLGFRFAGVETTDVWRGRRETLWAASLAPGQLRRTGQGPLPDDWPSLAR
jgi:RimJ/RimL family protein N-acetyltransferase